MATGATIDARRIGGWAGIATTVLLVASLFVVAAPPGMDAGAQEIKDYLLDNRSGGTLSVLAAALALPLFLFFLAGLREALTPPGTDGWLAGVSTRCGAYFGLGLVLGNACFYSATWTKETATGSADVFRVTWDLGYLVYLALFPLAAVLLIGTGIAAMRAGALHRWWAWIGIVVGVAIAIGTVAIVSYTTASVSFPTYLGFLVWLLIASILMVRSDHSTSNAQES